MLLLTDTASSGFRTKISTVRASQHFRLFRHIWQLLSAFTCSFLCLGHGGFECFALERVQVLAAHVARAGMLRLDKVAKLVGEELADDFVVGDGAPLHSQLQALELAFSPLKTLCQLGISHTGMTFAAGCSRTWHRRCRQTTLSLRKLSLGASQLYVQQIVLLGQLGKFFYRLSSDRLLLRILLHLIWKWIQNMLNRFAFFIGSGKNNWEQRMMFLKILFQWRIKMECDHEIKSDIR